MTEETATSSNPEAPVVNGSATDGSKSPGMRSAVRKVVKMRSKAELIMSKIRRLHSARKIDPLQPDSTTQNDEEFLSKYGQAMTKYEAPLEKQRKGILGRIESFAVNTANFSYYTWLTIVSMAVMYNTIMVICRATFMDINRAYWPLWVALDYVCDLVYLTDMAVSLRTGYLEEGLLVKDFNKLRHHYTRSRTFIIDVISVLPTDLIMLLASRDYVIVRLNRVVRLRRVNEFSERTEARTSWPNGFRILSTVVFIVVIIHWNACIYFALSKWIGFGSDEWVYDDSTPRESVARQYVYSFYWSTLTLTTIGEVPPPITNVEYLFVTIDFMIGVLIFATIVGNVGTVIANMNAAKTDFQTHRDNVKQYMEFRKVGKQLQTRVVKWFDYLWSNKQSLNDEAVLETLPIKLQTEIAIQVHFNTIRKVRIFQDTDAGLLAELVLKLKLQVFSPGDYICRKGDIGREMYIVKRGKINVVADDGTTVFATLSEGAVFGELSILNISGNKTGNRRSANVRSVGYSDLFALSKDDLWDALKEYPDARKMLIEKGREILMKDNLLDLSVPAEIKTPDEIAAELTQLGENLSTRLARLTAEQISTEQKLTARCDEMTRLMESRADGVVVEAAD